MDLRNLKMSIGMALAIIAQGFGLVWYVAQLDSTVSGLDSSVAQLQEASSTVDVALLEQDVATIKGILDDQKEFDPSDLEDGISDLEDAIDELKITTALLNNELRQVLADHARIGQALADLGQDALSENRELGGY